MAAANSHDFVLEALNDQSERIRELERSYTTTVVALKMGEKQFQQISEQISSLGNQVTSALDDLGQRVDGLSKQTSEHHRYLESLTADKKHRDQRKKLVKKMIWGGVAAGIVALFETCGENAWNWIKVLFHK